MLETVFKQGPAHFRRIQSLTWIRIRPAGIPGSGFGKNRNTGSNLIRLVLLIYFLSQHLWSKLLKKNQNICYILTLFWFFFNKYCKKIVMSIEGFWTRIKWSGSGHADKKKLNPHFFIRDELDTDKKIWGLKNRQFSENAIMSRKMHVHKL